MPYTKFKLVGIKKLTYFSAKLVSFSSESFNASAGHCSERKAVIHFAHCVCNARPEGSARIETFTSPSLGYTCLLTRALFVHFTSLINNWFWNCN